MKPSHRSDEGPERSTTGDDQGEAAELEQLDGPLAALAHDHRVTPPPALKQRILDGLPAQAMDRPVATPAEAFSHQVASFGELLASLDPEAWARPAAPYGWTVQQLVAHAAVIERYTRALLGLEGTVADLVAAVGGAEHDHLGLGSTAIAAAPAEPPDQTVQSWAGPATATADQLLAGGGPDRAGSVVVHGWTMSVDEFLIARSFELWTHGDDIRRSAGRAPVDPLSSDLRAMSDTSVRSLPLIAAAHPHVAATGRFGPVRVVLTGAGGGTWVLSGPPGRTPAPTESRAAATDGPAGKGVPPDAALVICDVVDYCRMAARRIPLDELTVVIEGDVPLARALLSGSSFLAV